MRAPQFAQNLVPACVGPLAGGGWDRRASSLIPLNTTLTLSSVLPRFRTWNRAVELTLTMHVPGDEWSFSTMTFTVSPSEPMDEFVLISSRLDDLSRTLQPWAAATSAAAESSSAGCPGRESAFRFTVIGFEARCIRFPLMALMQCASPSRPGSGNPFNLRLTSRTCSCGPWIRSLCSRWS